MNQKHLMPAARCIDTRQLVKKQDLSGRRYSVRERETVWLLSQALAEEMTARTRQQWTAEPIEY
jgi:hypothetical protein